MTDAPPDLDQSARLRDKRNGVILRAAIELERGPVERRVRNLSERGACVDNDGDLVAGTAVRVTMGQLEPLIADVAWANAKLAGLSFRRAVDLEAARKPRGPGTARAGWMDDIGEAYRRRA